MREFKFRYFDKREKKMYYGVEQTYDWEFMPVETGENDEYVLMQYTGVKNNKDEEIYDGDILSAIESTGGGSEAIYFTVKSVVYWSEDNGAWRVKEIGSDDSYELYDYSLIDNVIGNIYQNPELLK